MWEGDIISKLAHISSPVRKGKKEEREKKDKKETRKKI